MNDERRQARRQRGPAAKFWLNAGIVVAFGAAFMLAYLFSPAFGNGLRRAFALLGKADVVGLREYLISFGAWAPIVSTLLMLLQAIVLPLPAFVVAMVNGLLFGALWGSLLTWSTAVVGSVLCFYVTRSLGRPAADRLVSTRAMKRVDDFFRQYGTSAVLIARLLPFLSFSVVSYAAGLTSMSLLSYVAATAAGILPATILFCVLGQQMTNWYSFAIYAVAGVACLVGLGLYVRHFANRRLNARQATSGPGPEIEDSKWNQ